jgi:hypothetical protein
MDEKHSPDNEQGKIISNKPGHFIKEGDVDHGDVCTLHVSIAPCGGKHEYNGAKAHL